MVCLHLVATAGRCVSLYIPVCCSFLLYEPISNISRLERSFLHAVVWLSHTWSESNEISGGSYADTPSDGLITEKLRLYAGKNPHTRPSSPPSAIVPSVLRCLQNKQASINTQLRLSQLGRKSSVRAWRLIRKIFELSVMVESLTPVAFFIVVYSLV